MIGLFVAHITFYLRGGYMLVQHAVLRVMLAVTGVVPLRYRVFLDEGVERAILRRVGTGYMFRHHLLQESLGAADEPFSARAHR